MSDAYHRPRTVPEAVRLLETYGEDAHVLAGGTALTLLRKQGLIEPGVLVDLAGIDGLAGTERAPEGGLVIGAMATLRSIETSMVVREVAPALASAVARVATIRIRNQATLGGNLAHADAAQDPPPVLIILDAELVIEGADGTRHEPVASFFVDQFETTLRPGELLVAIGLPRPADHSRMGYEKFLPRTVDDYATVSVAARLDVAPDGTVVDARVALGAVASVPLRVRAAEDELRGSPLAELPIARAVAAVLAAVDPFDDVRGSADYKRKMAGVWSGRLLRRLASEPAAIPA